MNEKFAAAKNAVKYANDSFNAAMALLPYAKKAADMFLPTTCELIVCKAERIVNNAYETIKQQSYDYDKKGPGSRTIDKARRTAWLNTHKVIEAFHLVYCKTLDPHFNRGVAYAARIAAKDHLGKADYYLVRHLHRAWENWTCRGNYAVNTDAYNNFVVREEPYNKKGKGTFFLLPKTPGIALLLMGLTNLNDWGKSAQDYYFRHTYDEMSDYPIRQPLTI